MNRPQVCEKFHPEAGSFEAYIPIWPFEAKMCDECGAMGVDWGPFKLFVWGVVFGWWWNGLTLVKEK